MQCPIDGTQLVMADRSGVEIDYCPQCRGVWLDRGELDKIIERSAAISAAPPPPPPQAGYSDRGHSDTRRKKKRDGLGDLLGDIFDF
jgi:Zn-finger nucleic acid-binding protein